MKLMKNIIYYIILISISFEFIACKKEVNQSIIQSDKFLKIYTDFGRESLNFIKQTEDQGYLLIGNRVDSLIIYKVDKNGNLEWKNKLSEIDFNGVYAVSLKDGSIIIISLIKNGHMCKLDKNGNIVFITKYIWGGIGSNQIFYNSIPTQLNDGTFALPYTNGGATGSESNNRIAFINQDGFYFDSQTIYDSLLKPENYARFKNLELAIIKCEKKGDYFFSGRCFPNWNGNWNSNQDVYVSKQKYDDKGNLLYSKTKIIDKKQVNYDNTSYYHTRLKDGVLLIINRKNNNYFNDCRIYKVNDSLDIEWELDLNATPYGTDCYAATECPDGNFLITGNCFLIDKLNTQPLAIKISKNGSIIWQKIFNITLSASMNYGIENNDGTFVFGGQTVGFGKGNSLEDFLLIKTDANRNFN